MNLYPLLLRPRLYSIRQRWLGGRRGGLRDYLSLVTSLLMMAGIYVSTLSALRDTEAMLGSSPLNPEIPLRMVLTTLTVMLLLSAIITSLGALFLARDLELILSLPVSKTSFLLGKTGEVFLTSVWMLIIFGIPSFIAFGSFYSADALFYLAGPLLLVEMLSLPCLAAVCLALVFGAIIPPQRGRGVFLILFFVSLSAMLMYLTPSSGASQPAQSRAVELAAFTRFSSLSSFSLSPSSMVSSALVDLMRGKIEETLKAVVILGITALGLFATGLGILSLLYQRAHSRAQSSQLRQGKHTRKSKVPSRLSLPFISSEFQAVSSKEFKVFSRDLSHTVQLSLLLAICFIYLYNFKVLRPPDSADATLQRVWSSFLMICNVALSSMVVSSICTRFVFPSVSLEGASFWIVQTAPITSYYLLKMKFRAWFIPISLIGAVVFISGALALNAEGPLVLTSCIGGIILSYGLVGLSIGLGAVFSQFDWEYSAQISSTLGSFILMFASIFLLLVNLIPLSAMFAAYAFLPTEGTAIYPSSYAVMGFCLLVLFLMNKGLTQWALAAGAKALEPR